MACPSVSISTSISKYISIYIDETFLINSKEDTIVFFLIVILSNIQNGHSFIFFNIVREDSFATNIDMKIIIINRNIDCEKK